MSTYFESNYENSSIWLRCRIETDNLDGTLDISYEKGEKYVDVPVAMVRVNGKNSKFLPMRYDTMSACLRKKKVNKPKQDEYEGSFLESPTESELEHHEKATEQFKPPLSWKDNALQWISSYANSSLRCELSLTSVSPTSTIRQLQPLSCGSTPLPPSEESQQGESIDASNRIPFTTFPSNLPHIVHKPEVIRSKTKKDTIDALKVKIDRLEDENVGMKAQLTEMVRLYAILVADMAEIKKKQDNLVNGVSSYDVADISAHHPLS